MGQRGVTVVETLLVIGIMGVILPMIAASVRQLTVQTAQNNTRITALTNIEKAGLWLGRDVPKAHETNLPPDVSASSTLVLEWTDWSNVSQFDVYTEEEAAYERQRVTYSLSGTQLHRHYLTCSKWDYDADQCDTAGGGIWSAPTIHVVAKGITSIQFSRSGSTITTEIIAEPRGGGFPREGRTYSMYALLDAEIPLR